MSEVAQKDGKHGSIVWPYSIQVLLLILFINTIAITTQVQALNCAPPGPVDEEMQQSKVVFKGKAIKDKGDGLTVFQVEQAWKGVEQGIFEIFDNDGWDPFILNMDYLVFGNVRGGKLKTNLCGNSGPWNGIRSTAMNEANIDYITFDEALLEDDMEPSLIFGSTYAIYIMLVGIILAIIIYIFSRRIN